MDILRQGDRVRHKSGWEATVIEVTDHDTLRVHTDEVHLRGEYAAVAFTRADEDDETGT